MANLNCYRNLKPDPHSAPIHLIRPREAPVVDSKRQQKLDKLRARKAKLVLKKKNLKSLDQIETKISRKFVNGTSEKLECTLKADFQKDLWNCNFYFFFFFTDQNWEIKLNDLF